MNDRVIPEEHPEPREVRAIGSLLRYAEPGARQRSRVAFLWSAGPHVGAVSQLGNITCGERGLLRVDREALGCWTATRRRTPLPPRLPGGLRACSESTGAPDASQEPVHVNQRIHVPAFRVLRRCNSASAPHPVEYYARRRHSPISRPTLGELSASCCARNHINGRRDRTDLYGIDAGLACS
jgi:hypothetical protein